jgi:pyruvate,water dikinase
MGTGLLTFLEIIGLRAERTTVNPSAQLARFRLVHTEFRKLLAANNSFLETLGELDRKRRVDAHIDRGDVRRKVVRAVADVHSMVDSLNAIAGERYGALRKALDRITADLTGLIDDPRPAAPAELILDLGAIRASHAGLVGGKMAKIGQLRNVLGLPTPDGYVITTKAFDQFLEDAGLRSWIQSEQAELHDLGDIHRASAALRKAILNAAVSDSLEAAITTGYRRLAERIGPEVRVAVRSSALDEDGELSFAGQFLTLLNVPGHRLVECYLQIIASLYSAEAINYRLLHHISGESAEMAVGIIAMVDASCSGVAFSRDPAKPQPGQVLIQAVRGLGVSLVEGQVSPENIRVYLSTEGPKVLRGASGQKIRVVSAGDSGVKEELLPSEEALQPCLSDEQALQLAQWTLALEAHFGHPQDVEWAMGADGKLLLLQSRPLRVLMPSLKSERPEPGYPLLLQGGEAVFPGIGSGPAVQMDENGNIESFPEGGVLVARRSSPKFIRLMAKARAIVTDAGSTTGHMASLARELKVPTLLNTRSATSAIPHGTLITVDSAGGFVYAGEVPPLIERRLKQEAVKTGESPDRKTPERRLLEEILEHIAPLNLTDPRAASFNPGQCRTLHDLARYIHEKSYAEMFGFGERLGDFKAGSFQLDVFLPIDLYIIDLGGGLRETPAERKIKPSQITSAPMRAVLEGMLCRKIPRFGPRAMDLGGLFSVMMRHATTNPEEQGSFQNPCYALISDCYLNYSARVGYHFSVVDTYCSSNPNKNYISFMFRGGAADYVRRCRRIQAISEILKSHGFAVSLKNDAVTARLSKPGYAESMEKLEMIGRLLQFFRQLDAAMATDEHTQLIRDAFIRGDYDLNRSS